MSSSIRTQTVDVNDHLSSIPSNLVNALEHFTYQHYQLENLSDFYENILGLGKPGGLSVFYDSRNKIIGFTRICKQVIELHHKTISVYTGASYQNPRSNLGFSIAKFCLAKAMRYKLTQPEEEMVYIAQANTPIRYQVLAKLNNLFYPQVDIPIPKPILELVEPLKKLNHWESNSRHPMLINNQLPLLDHSSLEIEKSDLLTNYYLSLNPEYYKGTTLLVYLPITLTDIGMGIKRIITDIQPQKETLTSWT